MLTNLILLVLMGVLGYIISKSVGINPFVMVSGFLVTFSLFFLFVVPVTTILPEVQEFDAEAARAWTEDYFLRISTFIDNQTPGWVLGYVASSFTGLLVGNIK